MNKLYRLSLSLILCFGWLFLTPAYSDDPLSIAEQEIQDLRSKITNLNYKDDFINLIEQAEEQYDEAVSLKQEKNDAFSAYDSAVKVELEALNQKQIAKSDLNAHQMVVDYALQDKNEAYDTLDAANISLAAAQAVVDAAGNQGVSFQIYPLSRTLTGVAYIAEGSGLMCQGSIPSLNAWAGWGAICGLSENIIGIFTTTLTVPDGINSVKFAGYTDDGFRLYVDGVLATSQWQEQGSTWSPYTAWFDTATDKTLELQAWWYNGGGPGNMHVGWGHSNIWTGIPSEYLSYGSAITEEQLNAYNLAVEVQEDAQNDYNAKLLAYNNAVETLEDLSDDLLNKTTIYQNAKNSTNEALENKQQAESDYNQAIIDLNIVIDNAWEYYHEQLKRELEIAIAQAIAQAAANQPQPESTPTPEPSPEPQNSPDPTPEPTPEQTEPSDPTPTPEPETTDEPKIEPSPEPEQTPEPSPEPSPQPTDINPSPTPEPKPVPEIPSEESSNNATTEDLSGAIANLTSKDNKLVTLSPEQAAAVANVLTQLSQDAKIEVAKDFGIKASEIAVIAEAMKDNPILATAVVEFSSRAEENANAPMPYTLADATTELQTEAFLSDPLGALTNIDFEKILNPSEWGKDMTDDQREKAQEVIIPVVIASNIVAAAMTRRI